jgi:hypothetical protein
MHPESLPKHPKTLPMHPARFTMHAQTQKMANTPEK